MRQVDPPDAAACAGACEGELRAAVVAALKAAMVGRNATCSFNNLTVDDALGMTV
jgi:hypothetical protein